MGQLEHIERMRAARARVNERLEQLHKTVDAKEVVSQLGEGKFWRVYNKRTNATEFGLHKGSVKFLLQTRKNIEVLSRKQALSIVEQLTEVVGESRYRATGYGVEAEWNM